MNVIGTLSSPFICIPSYEVSASESASSASFPLGPSYLLHNSTGTSDQDGILDLLLICVCCQGHHHSSTQARGGMHPKSPSLTPPRLPCFRSAACMDVCSNPLSSLFSLLLHAQTILHTWSLERPFPNRVKRDPARHTCEVSLPPPGVGLDLKPDFPGQVLSCQFYLFFIYLFIFQFYTSMMLGKLVT